MEGAKKMTKRRKKQVKPRGQGKKRKRIRG